MSQHYRSILQLSGGGTPFTNTYSMSFDGVDEYFNGASTFSELDGQNKATFSMWVKPTLLSTSYSLYISEGSNIQFGIAIFNTGQVQAYINQGAYNVRTATSALNANTWQHILVCIDLSLSFFIRGAIYIDGIDATDSQNLNRSAFGTSTNNLFIGNRTALNLPYGGLMDEVSIWVGTDQRANVSDIYNGGVPFDLSTLATAPDHWWRMGDNDTWSGSQWTLSDNIGSYDLSSANMEEADRLPISPNSYTQNSFSFDGVDESFNCGSFSAYDNGDLSVSIWIKKTTMGTFESAIRNTGSSSVAGFSIIFENQFRRVAVARRTRTSDTATAYLDIGFTLDTWHNIAFTYKDSTRTLKVYRDGILQSTTIGSASTNTASTNLHIGSFNATSNFLNGLIDEVSIFNTELSASDISTIFNNGIPQDISSLSPISNWRMGESATWNGSTWTLTDQGSGGNNATSVNMEEADKTGDQAYVL